MTHSFARDGLSLNNILIAVSGSLTSLTVTNCNDIFTGPAFDQLSTLSQLAKLHITAVRTRFNPDSFKSLGGLKKLQVCSQDLSICAVHNHADLCCLMRQQSAYCSLRTLAVCIEPSHLLHCT